MSSVHMMWKPENVVAKHRIGDMEFILVRDDEDEAVEPKFYDYHPGYTLYQTGASASLRHREVGHLWAGAKGDTVDILSSRVEKDLRGRGLGRWMYREAINDLLRDYVAVRSDTNRSISSERIWRSLQRENPHVTLEGTKWPTQYVVRSHVRRRARDLGGSRRASGLGPKRW